MNKDSIARHAHPAPLKFGDKIRFVSPAGTPNREDIEEAAELLRSWGFEVDFGQHAFEKLNYLAGTDEQRLDDLNAAFRDEAVRAIFTTRGGKGSYRIAERIDFDAAKKDPKFLVGFSDITAIHLALAKRGIGGGIHGAVSVEDWEPQCHPKGTPLRELLIGSSDIVLKADESVETEHQGQARQRPCKPLENGRSVRPDRAQPAHVAALVEFSGWQTGPATENK